MLEMTAERRAGQKRFSVFNVGFTRYALPLDATEHKKFHALKDVANFTVLGLSRGLHYRCVGTDAAPARFFLLPLVPFGALRFLMVFFVAVFLGYRLGTRGEIQVFLSQSPYEALAGILLRGLLRFRRIELCVVTEVHGDFLESPFLYRFLPGRFLLVPLFRFWSGWVLRRSDSIRTISSFLERRIADLAPNVPRVRFPTYTDFERFEQKPPASSTSKNQASAVVFSAGALYPVKGFDVLLRVIAKLPDRVTLRIAGAGPEERSLKELAGTLGIETRVQFLGALGPDQIASELLGADIFALASRSEGLGRVVIEALLSGVPVVATASGGIPDLVAPDENGFLVAIDDVESMAEKIKWLTNHPERAREMGTRGAERMRSLFSTESYVAGYRAVFEAISQSP